VKFVLISQRRSGTHMLQTALGKCTKMLGEAFNKDYYNWGNLNTVKIIDEIFKKADGFILHLNHSPNVEKELIKRDVKFICLSRDNCLERYVSLKQAMLHKRWQVFREEDSPKLRPMTVDIKKLKQYIEDYNNALINFKINFENKEIFEVKYEDLISDYKTTISKILCFLGVENYESIPSPDTIKIGCDPYKLISNEDEVRNFLGQKLKIFI